MCFRDERTWTRPKWLQSIFLGLIRGVAYTYWGGTRANEISGEFEAR